MKASSLNDVKGKTIDRMEVAKEEASDGCWFASMEIYFTDGSMFSMLFHSQPQVHAQFFKGDADKDASKEILLVKP